MRIIDGMPCPEHSRGEWECQDCGLINQPDDAACECAHEADRREQRRRAAIEHHARRPHPLDCLADQYEAAALLARNATPPRTVEAIWAAGVAIKLRAIRRAPRPTPLSPAEAAQRCRDVAEG